MESSNLYDFAVAAKLHNQSARVQNHLLEHRIWQREPELHL